MQVIRTIVWALISAILVAFIAMNWDQARVNFWPIEGQGQYLHFDWPVGFTALVFFMLGFLPMWLLHRAQVWRLKRRVSSLENSLRAAAAVAPVVEEPVVITDQPSEPDSPNVP